MSADDRTIIIVSPEFPPTQGGVADHAAMLQKCLRRNIKTLVLTTGDEGIQNWQDHDAIERAVLARTMSGLSTPRRTTVVWEYVPEHYGSGGVNRALEKAMASLKVYGIKQVLLAHEIAKRWSAVPNHAYSAWQQRQQWLAVTQQVDAIGLSSQPAFDHWKPRLPGKRLFLFPSPSNILVHHPQRDLLQDLPPKEFILLFFGAVNALKQFGWVVDAHKALLSQGINARLVRIGHGPCKPSGHGPFLNLGSLPAPEVSTWLARADLITLPFKDGVSERRGSFMAALAHGRPVLTTFGPATGKSLRESSAFFSAESKDRAAFIQKALQLVNQPTQRNHVAAQGRDLYESEYSWPCITDQLLGILEKLDTPEK